MHSRVHAGADGSLPPHDATQAFERLLADLSARFVNIPPGEVDDAIVDSLRQIAEVLGVDRVVLLDLAVAAPEAMVTHSWAAPGIPPVSTRIMAARYPWAIGSLRAGHAVSFRSLGDLPPDAAVDRASWQGVGVRSHASVPMRVGGRVEGALAFGCHGREREWPEPIVGRIAVLADVFSNALAHKRARQALEAAVAFQELASGILAKLLIAGRSEQDRVIEQGLREMVCAFGVESATLWQRVGDADEFARTHQSRADGNAAPGLGSRVADPASRKLEDIDGSLVVPLGVEGSVVGALSFATGDGLRDWPGDLVSRARLLGEVLASMLARQAAERREQEARAQAAHAVRVGTMGVFAASLVHELTQPLAASLANAETASELLAAKSPDLAELRATVADIVTDDRRVGELIQQLRRLLRRGESKRADLNVGELVAEIRRVLANDARTRGIAFDLDVPGGLPAVFGDRVQVQQVLLNLLTNAFDAVDAAEAGSRHVALRAQSADGGVAIEVADTGVGMDATTRARIFEPFYTTKASGMGLGLVISRSIVATHGGSLGVDSSPGRGTTFKLVLPSRVREAPPVVERASIPVERRGTIVVIDDDPSMRRAVQRQLRSVGYDVELHESPASYLERSATRDPLCIVSDVRMPGTSGLDLQAALAREARALPIVFISAHGDVQTTASALKAGAIDFLAKPFSKGELLAAVAQAVARGRELEATHAKRSEIETRRASLTPREREVFALVAEGLPNKIIADRLGAAEATVKIHRSRVMEKMRAGSVADLVRMAESLDLRSSADRG